MNIKYNICRYNLLISLRKIIEFDNPGLKLIIINEKEVGLILEVYPPMQRFLRKIKYKFLLLIDRVLASENQFCYLATVRGRILLVEPDINCMYVLNENFDLVRCFLPRMLKPFLTSSHFLITITGYMTKDKSGFILLVHKGCSYFLDSNRPSIIDSEIIVGTF
jgi:hypothetical protein